MQSGKIKEVQFDETKRDLRGPEAIPSWTVQNIIKMLSVLVFCVVSFLPISIFQYLSSKFKTPKSVRGKVCVITGSGRGMGRRLAIELSRKGAIVVCADINQKNNEETVKLIKKEGGKAHAYHLNVADHKGVKEFAENVIKDVGNVDILVNNAALIMGVSVDEWTYEDIIATYNVNVLGYFWMIAAFLPYMKKKNEGHIINMSSVSSYFGVPFLTIYASCKAAITNLSEGIRIELNMMNLNNNIKVTTIHPYFVNTSADYMELVETCIPKVQEEDAVAEIVDAILKEKTDVTVPGYMVAIFPVLRLLPHVLQKFVINNGMSYFIKPNKALRQSIPYGDTVTACLKT